MGVRVVLIVHVSGCGVRDVGVEDRAPLDGGTAELSLEPGDDGVEPDVVSQVGEAETALPPHPERVALHHLERGSDVRRQVDLVDHEEIGAGDSRPSFAWDLVAASDVDHVDPDIDQVGAERRRQIVTSAFNENDYLL